MKFLYPLTIISILSIISITNFACEGKNEEDADNTITNRSNSPKQVYMLDQDVHTNLNVCSEFTIPAKTRVIALGIIEEGSCSDANITFEYKCATTSSLDNDPHVRTWFIDLKDANIDDPDKSANEICKNLKASHAIAL